MYVGGIFSMTGGEIKNRTAYGSGAGIYVADGATCKRSSRPTSLAIRKQAAKRTIITAPGGYKEYEPPVDPIDPDYPLISILPALAKDLLFIDVTSADWFYSDVKYAYENGLMTGNPATAFSPGAPVTRGMVS
ncbi:MAG: S-layer homology domain-containing protein [Acutalibacteraceae bacterium]